MQLECGSNCDKFLESTGVEEAPLRSRAFFPPSKQLVQIGFLKGELGKLILEWGGKPGEVVDDVFTVTGHLRKST